MALKLLMYGAGNIGRGFIGCIFARAGYEVVFVDIDRAVVDTLNRQGTYTVSIAAERPYPLAVSGVRGVDGRDQEAVTGEIASCDIMAVALGATALEQVAPIIAEGFARRIEAGRGPLDILVCENLKDAAHLLGSWIEAALPPEIRPEMNGLGLVPTAIGRMVPVKTAAAKSDDPLHVTVEEYDYLPVDAMAFRGPLPVVPQLVPHTPFAFYEERKLYLHNMGHAVCAYLGLIRGHQYIWQAVGDTAVRLIVQGAMVESASMLSIIHNIPFPSIFRHGEDLLLRFSNTALGDTCQRVARDPQRKIAAEDRLAAPIRRCGVLGISPACIAMGLAAALYHLGGDEAATRAALSQTCRLVDSEINLVMELYQLLTSGRPLEECIKAIDRIKHLQRGRTV